MLAIAGPIIVRKRGKHATSELLNISGSSNRNISLSYPQKAQKCLQLLYATSSKMGTRPKSSQTFTRVDEKKRSPFQLDREPCLPPKGESG